MLLKSESLNHSKKEELGLFFYKQLSKNLLGIFLNPFWYLTYTKVTDVGQNISYRSTTSVQALAL